MMYPLIEVEQELLLHDSEILRLLSSMVVSPLKLTIFKIVLLNWNWLQISQQGNLYVPS